MTVRVQPLDAQGNPLGIEFTALLARFATQFLPNLSVPELVDTKDQLDAGRPSYVTDKMGSHYRLTPTRL